MKVLFVTNLPSPYRVDFFNELSKKCDLTVVYERETSSEREADWRNEKERNFAEVFCKSKNISKDKTFGFQLVRKVKKMDFDCLIISGYSSPSVILLISYCKLRRIPYYIECDGGFAKKGKWLNEKLKKFLLKDAKAIFTTCEEQKNYFLSLGCKGQIFKYPFSSFSQDEIFKTPADASEKNQLRQELNITEEKIVITVGRFSYNNGYGKGYDKVLGAAKILNNSKIGWYVIGGQPTDEFVRMKDEMELDNLHFVDFKKKDELKKYYRAADVFVLMTVGDIWGLVINEAMACGLPIVTTDRCIAGLEMIQNSENGYVIPVGDQITLADKVDTLLHNDELREKISRNNLKKVEYWTIENMVNTHLQFLNLV